MNKQELINRLEKEALLQEEKAKTLRIHKELEEALFADGKRVGLLIALEGLKQLNGVPVKRSEVCGCNQRRIRYEFEIHENKCYFCKMPIEQTSSEA